MVDIIGIDHLSVAGESLYTSNLSNLVLFIVPIIHAVVPPSRGSLIHCPSPFSSLLPTHFPPASQLTFRLHRAISSLTPTEATALAFVLGAGIGSIMHLIFMLFLITIRRMRGLKYRSKEERRQARRAGRAARAFKKEGGVKLAEEVVEVLPGYGEGEGDRLVEKA